MLISNSSLVNNFCIMSTQFSDISHIFVNYNSYSSGTVADHVTAAVIFMPPTRRVPEALCFRVVRPYGNLVSTKSQEPLVDFLSYLAQGCTMTSSAP